MARKKPQKKSVSSKKTKRAPKKKAAKKPAPEQQAKPAKIDVTSQLRRIWLNIRRTYNISHDAFSNALSLLNDNEANMLYDFVIAGLYKDNVAQILQEHPELRGLISTDDDRLCMHDCYEALSWRLDRSEPVPKQRELVTKFRLAAKKTLIP